MTTRFYLSQIFEHAHSKQDAMITEVKDRSRMGLLRVFGSNEEEWISLEEASGAGEWRLKSTPEEGAN